MNAFRHPTPRRRRLALASLLAFASAACAQDPAAPGPEAAVGDLSIEQLGTIAVTSVTVPDRSWSGKASILIDAFWPTRMEPIFDSFTLALTLIFLASGRSKMAWPSRTVAPSMMTAADGRQPFEAGME